MLHKTANRLVILSAIAIAPGCGSAATLVRYEFLSDYSAAEVATEIVTTDFNSGSAITDVSLEGDGQPPNSWSGTNWTTSSDSADALVGDSYVWFRVTPQAGYSMTLSGMTIDIRPHGSGPDDFVVSVVDILTDVSTQFGGVIAHADQRTLGSEFKTWETLFATSSDFQNLTSTQEIRIYGFDAKQADREVLFDNIQINGSISPIPEPAVFSLLALAGGILVGRRRRHCAASAPMNS